MTGDVPASSDSVCLPEYGEEQSSRWDWVAWRYRQYRVSLQRFFANRINNSSDVNDLVQKVFVRVLQRESDAPIENAQGYLFQVAASVLNDEYRRSRVRHEQHSEPYDEALHTPRNDISPERILLGEEAVERLATAVKQLPELTRDVYILRVHLECEHKEIANKLGISTRCAQRHMALALKTLKAILDEDSPLDALATREDRQ